MDTWLHLPVLQVTTGMRSTTIASPFALRIIEGALAKGHNVDKLLWDNGITPPILSEPRSRVSFLQLSRVIHELIVLTGDEQFGLCNKAFLPNTLKHLCLSAIHGRTVGEVLTLMEEFFTLLNGTLAVTTRHDNGTTKLILEIKPEAHIVNHFAFDNMFLVIHRTLCWMADCRIPLQCVELNYPAPQYAEEYRHLFFDAPVSFDQSENAITFDNTLLAIEVQRTKEDLPAFLRKTPLIFLTQTFTSEDHALRIRHWLERQLKKHQQSPTIETAAEHFGLHPQAIRRRLEREGYTYKELKTQVRRDLAIYWINTSSLSIEDIAGKLGFSDARAFIRAFKGWTGLTPLAYRKNHA